MVVIKLENEKVLFHYFYEQSKVENEILDRFRSRVRELMELQAHETC